VCCASGVGATVKARPRKVARWQPLLILCELVVSEKPHYDGDGSGRWVEAAVALPVPEPGAGHQGPAPRALASSLGSAYLVPLMDCYPKLLIRRMRLRQVGNIFNGLPFRI